MIRGSEADVIVLLWTVAEEEFENGSEKILGQHGYWYAKGLPQSTYKRYRHTHLAVM